MVMGKMLLELVECKLKKFGINKNDMFYLEGHKYGLIYYDGKKFMQKYSMDDEYYELFEDDIILYILDSKLVKVDERRTK